MSFEIFTVWPPADPAAPETSERMFVGVVSEAELGAAFAEELELARVTGGAVEILRRS